MRDIIQSEPCTITTHAKLMIIDSGIVVVGSHNWTYSALAENNETSIVINSSDINSDETVYFQGIWDNL